MGLGSFALVLFTTNNTNTLPKISTSGFFFFALLRKCETTKQKGYPTPSTLSEILTCNLQPATCNLQFTPSANYLAAPTDAAPQFF